MIINSFVTDKRHVVFADNKNGYYVSNGEKSSTYENYNRAEKQFMLFVEEIIKNKRNE